MKITYQQKRGPESMPVDKYAVRIRAEWMALLSKDSAEKNVQDFLEQNPALVPGAWTPGSPSGHFPHHCALISQPELPGLSSKRPDFAWIATHSGTWYPTLIELEAPGKHIFTKKGTPRAEFSQARNQLAEWRTWFNDPTNVGLFIKEYGVPSYFVQHRTMKLHMILIYGRRSEFETNPILSRQRGSLLPGDDEELMSYDRLVVDSDLVQSISVRAKGSGRYRVKYVPPIFGTTPDLAYRLLDIDGFEKALFSENRMSEDRKKFIVSRVRYWRNWARSGDGTAYYGPGRYLE